MSNTNTEIIPAYFINGIKRGDGRKQISAMTVMKLSGIYNLTLNESSGTLKLTRMFWRLVSVKSWTS